MLEVSFVLFGGFKVMRLELFKNYSFLLLIKYFGWVRYFLYVFLG